MRFLKSATFAVCVLIACSNQAAAVSTVISLGEANMAPGDVLSLPLDGLYDRMFYDVVCTIRNDNAGAEDISALYIQEYDATYNIQVFVDERIVSTVRAVPFKSAGSELKFSPVRRQSRITLRSLDATDIYSGECKAILQLE